MVQQSFTSSIKYLPEFATNFHSLSLFLICINYDVMYDADAYVYVHMYSLH
jgi:hypothetical protein